MPQTRQLIAIMFTDIQDFTATMQQDEELAIKIRDRHREIFNSATDKFKGKILQYFGDGTLSTFVSAIDAVKCAMEMQMAFQIEPVIPVRIGIHLGDVVLKEDDIIGDGVNVASRIESLAVPGSVFVSDKVYDEIKNHPSIETQSLKTFELKNVDRPIEVFAISNKGLIIPGADEIIGKTKDSRPITEISAEQEKQKARKKRINLLLYSIIGIIIIAAGYNLIQDYFFSDRNIKIPEKSIAVLAFTNMSDDPNQEYFSDGISEEILNSLVKVDGLKVAGRTSSFSFKGTEEDIRSIGEKLGVSLVLEGSVRKSENRVRITTQLINVADGYHIWSEQFDRELSDIFSIQEEIASKVVKMLKLTILKSEKSKQPTTNIEAYDLYLKGLYSLSRDVEGTIDALNYFQKAIELDPEFALAYAGKGDAFLNYSAYGIIPGEEALMEARKAAKKSISLDSKQAYGHKVLAYVHLFYDWDWEAAKSEYQIALDLGLLDPDHFITWYNAFLYENYTSAIYESKIIADRDPLSVEAHWHLGVCYLMADQYENAINSFNYTLELDPNYSEGYRWLGKTYRVMGKYEEALSALNAALEMTSGQGPAYHEMIIALASSGQIEEASILLDDLLKSESDKHIPTGAIAAVCANLGRFDEAFELLEQCFEERSMTLVTLKALSDFDVMRDDPRYESIIKRMNFPE